MVHLTSRFVYNLWGIGCVSQQLLHPGSYVDTKLYGVELGLVLLFHRDLLGVPASHDGDSLSVSYILGGCIYP